MGFAVIFGTAFFVQHDHPSELESALWKDPNFVATDATTAAKRLTFHTTSYPNFWPH